MAKAKKFNADVMCPSCNSRVFYIGSQYNSGGNMAYTLRCAKCRGRSGEGTYVKNISSEMFDRLRSEGRIVANITSNPGTVQPQAPSQGITPPQINSQVGNLGIVPQQDTVPPPPNVQSQVPSQMPWDADPTAPPRYQPNIANTNERKELSGNCPACKMKKPISVEGTEFSVLIANSELTYLNRFTGQVIFMHKVGYCPYCGSKL